MTASAVIDNLNHAEFNDFVALAIVRQLFEQAKRDIMRMRPGFNPDHHDPGLLRFEPEPGNPKGRLRFLVSYAGTDLYHTEFYFKKVDGIPEDRVVTKPVNAESHAHHAV